jgi:hypothetical protein
MASFKHFVGSNYQGLYQCEARSSFWICECQARSKAYAVRVLIHYQAYHTI